MTDNHVHIGQFEDIYYHGLEIADIIMSSGMEALSFSSTTSCADNITYIDIEKEILELLSKVSYLHEIIRPFLWYIPEYINQNISVQNAFAAVPYKGIKLHPQAHKWMFDNNQHMEVLHSLFDYADQNSLPILIHTGENVVDSPDRFEYFFREYTNVQCILAHSRPLDTTIEMLKKYTNMLCDTAFVSEDNVHLLISAGYREKILFGSDFPITHYFNNKYGDNQKNTLKEQYEKDKAICMCFK
jgi:predicted TIM-barrel fold metal-dependent hydrolase